MPTVTDEAGARVGKGRRCSFVGERCSGVSPCPSALGWAIGHWSFVSVLSISPSELEWLVNDDRLTIVNPRASWLIVDR